MKDYFFSLFDVLTTDILICGTFIGFLIKCFVNILSEYFELKHKLPLTGDSFKSDSNFDFNKLLLKGRDNGEGSSKDAPKDNEEGSSKDDSKNSGEGSSKDAPKDNGEGSSKDAPQPSRWTLKDLLGYDSDDNAYTYRPYVETVAPPKLDKKTAAENIDKYMKMLEEYEDSGKNVPAASAQKAILREKIAECEAVLFEEDSSEEDKPKEEKKGKEVERKDK